MELDRFRLYLVQNGNKTSSIKEMMKLVNRLATENPSFSKEGFDSFVLHLKDQGMLNKSINHFVSAIRHWGKCFGISDLTSYARIKGDNSTFIKATMSDEEIETFLSLPYRAQHEFMNIPFYKQKYRMWTIFFSILAYTGARPSEVSHLHIDDVDFGRNIFLFDGKTGKRTVPISFVIKEQLREYIALIQTDKLFCPPRAKGYFDGSDWRYPFAQRIKRMGIKRKNLTPYSLRHSFISRFIEQDVALFKIQSLVGHRQIATTAKYVHLSEKSMQDAVTKDPLSKKYLQGIEMLQDILSGIQEKQKLYHEKIVSSIRESLNGEKVVIELQVKKE